MSQVTKRGPVKPALNITPLIDVVFLLIVFFMLVNNIVTDEAPPLQLPDLIDPVTHEADADSRVVVNIIPMQAFEPPEGEKIGPGKKEIQVLSRAGEAEAVQLGPTKWNLLDPNGLKDFQEKCKDTIAVRFAASRKTPPLILLRADAGVYYSAVLPVMNVMQAAMAEALGPEAAAKTPIHLVAYMPQ